MKAGRWSLRPAFCCRRAGTSKKKDAKFRLRDIPVFLKTKTGMLDTSVTFYSGISTTIISAWQHRHVYGQSQVEKFLRYEQYSGAGSGTGSIFLSSSFFPRTDRPRSLQAVAMICLRG